jgi:type IV pilus assembly protein PilV
MSKNMPRNRAFPCIRSSERGFSLIEAMVALAIFAIGSLGILSLFLGSFSSSAENQNLTSGYEIAQSAIGVLRANGSNALAMNGATVTPSGASNVALAPVASVMSAYGMAPQAQVSLTVSSLLGSQQCPCSATVSVSWGGGAQTYQSQTVVGY